MFKQNKIRSRVKTCKNYHSKKSIKSDNLSTLNANSNEWVIYYRENSKNCTTHIIFDFPHINKKIFNYCAHYMSLKLIVIIEVSVKKYYNCTK